MNSNEDRRSEELDDSDLDRVSGGTGESPPPPEDDKDPGGVELPPDGQAPPPEDPHNPGGV